MLAIRQLVIEILKLHSHAKAKWNFEFPYCWLQAVIYFESLTIESGE